MAPSGVAIRGGDLAAQSRRHAGARAAGEPRGGAQTVRDRGGRLAGDRGVRAAAAAAVVHARLGPEPGAALPTFRRGGATADQVDGLRRLGGGRVVRDSHDRLDLLPRGVVDYRGPGVVVEPPDVRG